MARLYRLFVQN